MPEWLRIVLALIVGVIGGGLCIAGVETVGHAVSDGEGQFWAAAIALGIAAFVGGGLAILIGRRTILAWGVGAVLAALSLVNVFSFAHPGWFVPVAMALLVLGAFAAARVFARSRADLR